MDVRPRWLGAVAHPTPGPPQPEWNHVSDHIVPQDVSDGTATCAPVSPEFGYEARELAGAEQMGQRAPAARIDCVIAAKPIHDQARAGGSGPPAKCVVCVVGEARNAAEPLECSFEVGETRLAVADKISHVDVRHVAPAELDPTACVLQRTVVIFTHDTG